VKKDKYISATNRKMGSKDGSKEGRIEKEKERERTHTTNRKSLVM
tara:strand:+ start:277 stop:411 length:135 start_codon:yes stop_codon:yes gene_type:complete